MMFLKSCLYYTRAKWNVCWSSIHSRNNWLSLTVPSFQDNWYSGQLNYTSDANWSVQEPFVVPVSKRNIKYRILIKKKKKSQETPNKPLLFCNSSPQWMFRKKSEDTDCTPLSSRKSSYSKTLSVWPPMLMIILALIINGGGWLVRTKTNLHTSGQE